MGWTLWIFIRATALGGSMESIAHDVRRAARSLLKPNFVKLHWFYIIVCCGFCWLTLGLNGGMAAVDSLVMAVSACTTTGLNVVDLKSLPTWRQWALYMFPIITSQSFGFARIVVERLRRIRKEFIDFARRLRSLPPTPATPTASTTASHRQSLLEENAGEYELSVLGRAASHDAPATREAGPSLREPQSQVEDGQSPDGPATSTSSAGIARSQVQERRPGVGSAASISTTGSRNDSSASASNAVHAAQRAGSHHDDAEPFLDEHVHWAQDFANEAHPSRSNSHESSRSTQPAERTDGMETLARVDSRRRSHTHVTRAAERIEHIASIMFVPGPPTAHSHPRSPASLADVVSSRANNAEIRALRAKAGKWWQLCGAEERALVVLLVLLIAYPLLWYFIGFFGLLIWIHLADAKYTEYLASQGVGKAWWAAYTATSMFTNLGMTLTPDSMIHFADAPAPISLMTFLQYAGNTMYPVFLRVLIWIIWKSWSKDHSWREAVNYLLQHPRHCCLLLFPAKHTWILFGIGLGLNFFEALATGVANWKRPVLTEFPVGLDKTEALPVGDQVLPTWFQAVNTRHTGAAVLNIAMFHPGVKASIMALMYFSSYPITLTMRASNVHGPGVVASSEGSQNEGSQNEDSQSNKSGKFGSSRVRELFKDQLGFDMWCLTLGTLIILFIEGDRVEKDPDVTIFSIMFEVVSAYGNVGLSLGYTGTSTSLCTQFKPASKVILCALMIQGRHRGMPDPLDRAITVPGEKLVNEALAREAEHANPATV